MADVDLSAYQKTFLGTTAEWNAKTTAQKIEYDEADITDDLGGGMVVTDNIVSGDYNPITSNAVAQIVPSGASASNKLVTTSQNNFAYDNLVSTVSDLNDLVSLGVHSCNISDATAAHAPTTGWLQLFVTRSNNDAKYVQQLCISMGANMYVRTSQNNNWSAWKQVTMS